MGTTCKVRSARGDGAERVAQLRIVVVIVWAGAATLGLVGRYGWRSSRARRLPSARVTAFPAALTFAHPALATAGLVFWAAFACSRDVVFAWAAFGVLAAAAMLGFALLTRWLVSGGKHAAGTGQRIPPRLILVHGAAGLATFVLALVAANLAAYVH
jgi:hypothetical protein